MKPASICKLLATSLSLCTGICTVPVSAEPITLFYPGKHSLEWMLSDHEGSKQFRRGSSCVSCHEGEAAEMGKRAMEKDGKKIAGNKAHRQGQLNFVAKDGRLQVKFSFPSAREAFTFSLLFDDERTSAFQRAGCWAVCHDDMKSMPSAIGLGKYLGNTRQKVGRSGGGKALKSAAELDQLIQQGVFLELWTVDVTADGKVSSKQMRVFDALQPINPENIEASASYSGGEWHVTVTRPLDVPGEKAIVSEQSFGIALQSFGNQGADHWVSLPWRFGTADNVDFKVSQ